MPKTETPSKGFVIVATRNKPFLMSARNLCGSIKDFFPEAKVAFFTEQAWIDEEDLSEFDYVYPTPGNNIREKMYGIANTPFDQTFYIDADCEVAHEDIENVFDHLDGYDMAWVELTEIAKTHFTEWDWGEGPGQHLTHCGGVCLYDTRNPLVREFMTDWYELHLQQKSGHWRPKEFEGIPESFMQWDQLTLWWLIHHSPKYKSLKWKFFEDNYRWNYFTSFGFNLDGTHNYGVVDPVVIHYSSWMDKYGKQGILV